jgi:PAS domain S-box-containing protein
MFGAGPEPSVDAGGAYAPRAGADAAAPAWRVERWVPVTYAVLAGLWIATSDLVVAAIAGSAAEAARWSMLKGMLFVAVTTAGLWLGLAAALARVRGAERALRRSEARLRHFVEHAPAGVAMFDREMRYLAASRRWLLDHGVDDDAMGRCLYEVTPAVPGHWRDVHARCLAGAVEGREEELAPWSTPERPAWLRWECRPWHDDRGEIGGIILSSESITERRQAAESARRYELLAESTRDVILFVRPGDWRILEANRAAVETYGWSRAELLGRTVPDLRAEPAAEEVGSQLRAADAGGALYETRHRRRDGSTFPVEINAKGASLGERRVIVAVVRDLTARKAAEDALAARERDLRTILETALDGISVSSPAGRFLEVNDAFCAMLGWSRAELVGKHIADVEALESAADIEARIGRLAATGGDRFDSRYRRKDGTLLDVEVAVRRIDAGGRIAGFIRDVTERRLLEARLHQAEKLESIGRLAGGVAHDFNNLLTVIMSCAEGLREGIAAGAPPSREDAEEILAAGRRAGDLTRQLLAFARKQVIAPITLDLLEAVRGSERLLRRVLGEDVELAVSGGPAPWPVRCDPGQLEQVILNLALNARDAMPGGGRIVLSVENVEVGARHLAAYPFMRPGSYVRMIFADTGRGMSAEVKQHIFEPFFTTKPRGQGTGLGLATVYGIVKQSDGYILVESEEGQGTRFEVYLPRAAGERAPASPPPPTVARGGSETVLVVEDEPLVRAVTARALAAAGYRVLVAADGGEALDIAAREPRLDLLVTDVIMPGKSGRAVADELRRERPGLRVLFVSGYPRDAISRAGVLDSGVEFLPKPFTALVLQERVRHVLDQRPAPA